MQSTYDELHLAPYLIPNLNTLCILANVDSSMTLVGSTGERGNGGAHWNGGSMDLNKHWMEAAETPVCLTFLP